MLSFSKVHRSAPKLRNFSCTPTTLKKIDPSRFPNLPSNTGVINAESINYFREMERKMLKERYNIDKGYLHNQYETYWPTRMEDRAEKAAELDDPHGTESFEQDNDLTGPIKDYDPLDLDSPGGFAKALSYVSAERSLEINPYPRPQVSGWLTEDLLKVSRHTKVTAAGRVFSFSALVMIGSTQGSAGLGYGRGPTVLQAIEMARLNAEKNSMSLILHRGNSIGKDMKCVYKKSWVRMKCCRTGWGLNAGWDMKQVLRAFGIEDVSVKQGGARNRGARYRAIFLGLRNGVRTKEQVAKILGRKLFNKQRCWYHSGD